MRYFAILTMLVLAGVSQAVIPLKQSTATTILFERPLVDVTDGYTAEDTLTVHGWTANLVKGTTSASITVTASGGDNDAVHVAAGLWSLELTAANTGTLGQLTITVDDPNCRPLVQECWVYPADTYDPMFTQGFADAADGSDFVQVGLTAQGLTTTRAGYLDNINNTDLATTVAQTGDAYALVSHAVYGLQRLYALWFGKL
jgi:hypothetical protein